MAPENGYDTCQLVDKHFLKSVPCWFYYAVAVCYKIITGNLHEVALNMGSQICVVLYENFQSHLWLRVQQYPTKYGTVLLSYHAVFGMCATEAQKCTC